jgi:hypothetical protein
MKKIYLLIAFCLMASSIVFVSCTKENTKETIEKGDTTTIVKEVTTYKDTIRVDFGYSVVPNGSGYTVSGSDASYLIPVHQSSYKWYVDGADVGSSNHFTTNISEDDARHCITLTISVQGKNNNDYYYSKSKQFEIKNKSIISDDLPSSLSKEYSVIVDFVYSLEYSSDSTVCYISLADASSNIPSLGVVYEWNINGTQLEASSILKNKPYYKNGFYFVAHSIIVENLSYSCYKQFEINGIK